MYSNVSLGDSDNSAQLLELGFKLVSEKGKEFFKQPCVGFQPRCCSVYEKRPSTCRQYRCALLSRHDAGDISTEKALSLIKDTIGLRDRVRPEVEHFVGAEPSLSLHELFKLMVDKLDKMDVDERKRANPVMQLDVGMLRVLLANHFELKDAMLSESAQDGKK